MFSILLIFVHTAVVNGLNGINQLFASLNTTVKNINFD